MLDNKHKDKESHKKVFQSVYKKWEAGRNDISKGNEDPDLLMPLLKDGLMKEMEAQLAVAIQDGKYRALKEARVEDTANAGSIRIPVFQIEEDIDKTITKILKDVSKNLKRTDDAGAVFDALEYRIRYLIEYSIPKTYWYAYAKMCSEIGIDKVYVHFKGSHDADNHSEVIDTNRIDWKSIPAFHAFCDCELALKKAGENK